MNRQLRPYQIQAIDMLSHSIGLDKRRVVLQGATGFGKTRLAATLVQRALAKAQTCNFHGPGAGIDRSNCESVLE